MNADKLMKEYYGTAFLDKLSPLAREVVVTNMNYMLVAFGENVEYERLFHQMLLCPETKDYLYRAPEKPTYEWGTRPVLEKAVAEATKGAATDRERVLGLMCYIRDLKDKSRGNDYFYGGTEEELIKKGERYCERVSRLMCALCEIARIPSRIIFHVSGGHLTNEVFIDGKWSYIDTRFGLFYLDKDGKMMSVTEIMANPDAIDNQPDWVYEYGSKEYTHEFMRRENRNTYLRPGEIQLYGNYSLRDREMYHFNWMPSAVYNIPARNEAYKLWAEPRLKYIEQTKVI